MNKRPDKSETFEQILKLQEEYFNYNKNNPSAKLCKLIYI